MNLDPQLPSLGSLGVFFRRRRLHPVPPERIRENLVYLILGLVGLGLLMSIAWAAWTSVAALRHLTNQQAVSVQLLLKIEEKLASPHEYGEATWRELEALQRRNRLEDQERWAPTFDVPRGEAH